jgi:hypothetical protein
MCRRPIFVWLFGRSAVWNGGKLRRWGGLVTTNKESHPGGIRRNNSGPRRAKSVEAYLRHTRVMAILVLAALIASVASDLTGGTFWERHALLASLVSSVIVVMLSVAVVNEVLERRRRQRWSVLAQYVMFELVRNARMIWTGVLDLAGLLPTGANQRDSIELGSQIVRDTPRLTAAVRKIVDDDDLLGRMHTEVAFLAEHADEVLGRWAAVMLNAELYAEVIDRHVELAGELAWIGGVLDVAYPPDDARRQKGARSSPALQIDADQGGGWLADRIVVITQLAESLDRGTIELALHIVPVEWWQERLGTSSSPAPSADTAQR